MSRIQDKPEISLVMPCYNEQASLRNTARALLQAFANHHIRLELVLVDNGSKDNTGEIISELVAEGLPVVKVSVPVNQGYGHGILEGLRHCSAPVLGYLCADGQVSAEDTVRVYKLLLSTDGHSIAKVRRRFRKDGLVRKITSISYNALMLLVFGRLEAIDLNGSPKIFSQETYRKMGLQSKDWFLDPEIMIKAKHLELMVYELNVRGAMRQGGKSNVKWTTCLEFLKNIFRYRFGKTIRDWRAGATSTPAVPPSSTAPEQNRGASAPGAGRAAATAVDGILGTARVLEQPRFEDARGYLQKVLMASQCGGTPPRGEVYVTAALPGEAKGNHLHRKMGEWFSIVQGEGAVEMCDPETGERRSVALGVSRPRTVFVPAGVAHAVVNTGKEPVVCVAWAEADYDAADIFPYPVWPPVGTEKSRKRSPAKPAVAATPEPELIHERKICRACGNDKLILFLSLGDLPLANSFLKKEQLTQPEGRYPLGMNFCPACTLVQLRHVVDPKVLFSNYLYRTGTNQTIARHNAQLAGAVAGELGLGAQDLVVEVGSNDGSLLSCFRERGVRTLGVEPAANIARIARDAGVETVNEFFDGGCAARIAEKHGLAGAVIANNVLAHVDETVGFLAACKKALRPGGRVVIEVPYLVEMLKRLEYDTIYHEHLCYFSVSALQHMFSQAGLQLRRVDRVEIHGGSLRLWGEHASEAGHHASVQKMAEEERRAGLHDAATYHAFAERVAKNREDLRALLEKLKREGKSIAGYGAPAKGTTLLSYCNIGTEWIAYTADRSPLKLGWHMPGSHIPIVPVERILKEQPDYVLILAWNFAPEIMESLREYQQKGGKFILPIPEPTLV